MNIFGTSGALRNPEKSLYFSLRLTLEVLGHPDEVRSVHPGPARHVGEADVGAARQAVTVDRSVWKFNSTLLFGWFVHGWRIGDM